jgi:uncharacterized protein (DUF58 family)
MRLRPTLLGWKGALLMAALLLAHCAAPYSNLFFLMVAFGFVLGGIGALLAVVDVRAIRAVAVDAPLAAAGARRPATLRLVGGERARGIAVALLLHDGEAPLGNVVAGATTATGELAARPRGIESATRVRVRSSWPFGLFVASRTLPCALELVTHPAPATRSAALGHGGHARAHARGEREPSVAGVRPFRAGDALGDVDWRATARRLEPMTKERDQRAIDPATLVVDRRLPADAFEAALATTTAEVLAHAQRGAPLRLRSQGCDLALAARAVGAAPLLRWLAAASPLPEGAPPPEDSR